MSVGDFVGTLRQSSLSHRPRMVLESKSHLGELWLGYAHSARASEGSRDPLANGFFAHGRVLGQAGNKRMPRIIEAKIDPCFGGRCLVRSFVAVVAHLGDPGR